MFRINIILYLCVLAFGTTIGMVFWRNFTKSFRILVVLFATTFVFETIAVFLAITIQSNSLLYHIFGPINLGLNAMYFQFALSGFQKKNIFPAIFLLGVIAAVLNVIFFQGIHEFNTNFLLFSGLCIIAMALFSFLYLAQNGKEKLTKYHLFWVSLIFLIFWCSTLFSFALFHIFLIEGMIGDLKSVYFSLWLSNVLQYLCLGSLIFYYGLKMKKL